MVSPKAVAIMEAGQRLFFEQGIQDTSMEQIAEAVPVAKMTIYNYFQSKEGLLKAILDRLMEESHQLLQRLIAETRDIRDLFEQLMNYREFDRVSSKFLSDLNQFYPAMMEKMMSYQGNRIIPEFEAALFRGQQAGDIRKDLSPHLIVFFILSMKRFISNPGMLDESIHVRTLADQMMTMLCHGILTKRDVQSVE